MEKIRGEQLQNVDFKKTAALPLYITKKESFNAFWQKQKQKTAQNAAVSQFRRIK